jgi:hypothetical protein
MCLLNGQIQGTIPESIILHNKEIYIEPEDESKEAERKLVPTLIKDIIYELVSHYGKENKGKIIINDIPNYGRLLVKYIGTNPLYLKENNNSYQIVNATEEYTDVKNYGDLLGYKITKLIYPGELIANVGEAVTTMLDKICNTFGNFEYFYDVDGNFIFQEKKNYLNNSYVPLTSDEITGKLIANFNKSKIDYSFKDNKIVSAFTNNPKWENIKNDFVVWGKRTGLTGQEYPIHFHLAIDNLPPEQDGKDYRQVILENDIKVGESAASDYYRELSAFWSQNYDGTNFTDLVTQDPSSLNYWLEIYPAAGKYAKYSVPAIGRRTYAVNDDNATCIYPPEVPGIVWWSEADVDFNNLDDCKTIAKNYFNGYPLAKMPAELA